MQTTEDSIKQLTAKVDDRCRELFGNMLPDEVAKRLEAEWEVLQKPGWLIEFQGLMIIKQICHENNCPFIIRSVESSFIAYLLGLSIVDPLPPHYLCPECKRAEFPKDDTALCGPDLPDKLCPVCGTPMLKSGFDAQMEFLFSRICPYSEVRVSSMIINTIRDGLTDLYEEHEPEIDSDFMLLSSKPDGAAVIVLIELVENYEEDPLLQKNGLITDDIPTAGTGNFNELIDEIIRTMERRNWPCIKEIADIVSPLCFEDIIRIDGLGHVEETWKPLMEDNRPLREIITSRDDVFQALIRHGMDREKAYKIASAVRKGRCFEGKHPKWPEWEKEMQEIGISDWYIRSMKRILYLWPRASCAADVIRAYWSAWLKMHNHGA